VLLPSYANTANRRPEMLLQNVGGVAGSVIGLNNGLKTSAALDHVNNSDDLAQLGRTTRYSSSGSFGGYGSYF